MWKRKIRARWRATSMAAMASVVGFVACSGPPTADAPADLLILNGKVYPAVDGISVAEAVAVRGNSVLRVGSNRELEALRGSETKVINANGGSVLPGFNDSHVHFLNGALGLEEVDLAGLTKLSDIQAKIRGFAAAHPDRTWIRGRGWLYSPFPGGLPTKTQLDAVISDRPALMNCYDGHSVWVNSKALELAGITRDTPSPPNGVIVKDPNTGEPTGVLKEAASELINKVSPSPTHEERRLAIRTASAFAHRVGVTSVQNAGGTPDELQLFEEARKRGDLAARTYYALMVSPGFSVADADRFDAAWQQHRDNPILKTGIVKIMIDGVIESRTAAMLAPYAGTTATGTPNYSATELNRIVAMMDRRGWQIQIHAIGDRGVRMTLDAFEHAIVENPSVSRGRRHRIEHVETIDSDDIPRFAKLGLIASMQPMHVALGDMNSIHPAGPWPDNLGFDRAMRAWQWKRIHDTGARLTFGSDWGVASLDPLQGIWLASTRVTPQGMNDQRLSVRHAVDAYTSWAAYASFEEHRKGSLTPGMLADITVLSRDILAAPPATPSDVVVEATVFDGKVVYERDGKAGSSRNQ